jgi:hypothetical protein
MANGIANREGYEPFTNTQIIFNLVNRQVEPEFLPMVESRESTRSRLRAFTAPTLLCSRINTSQEKGKSFLKTLLSRDA